MTSLSNNLKNLTRHEGSVSEQRRASVLAQKPITVWLTGLSAAGKSTLAYALEHALIDAGKACYVLDGDNLRHGLNANLSFSAEDRAENIRRAAEVASLMNKAGLIVIAALISPLEKDRAMAKHIMGESCFAEVFVNPGLDVCEKRDPKGLYKKARSGAIDNFTGISAPYEAPVFPDLVIDTGNQPLEGCVAVLFDFVMTRVAH